MMVGLIAAGSSRAATILTGKLTDPANPALVFSDLSPARFDTPADEANNLALYTLSLPSAGAVTITSLGFAAGGADPYFTLFAGAGNAATFLASNYDQAFSTGGDFTYSAMLAAGTYRIALGVFANESFAENAGSGTLADGFIQLGEASSLRSGLYELTITQGGGSTNVPEAPSIALLLGALACSRWRRRKRR